MRRNPSTTLLAASLIALAAAAELDRLEREFIRQLLITNGIAVLPFENLSSDPDNAHFAEGIQEEILTRLAGHRGFESNFPYFHAALSEQTSKSSSDREAAWRSQHSRGQRAKVGDQVRVSVQLINAQTDSHLWAETFDRKLIDIFEVESEIAKRIAESLQAKLTSNEEQALAVKPTNNPAAYDAYLRGVAFEAGVTTADSRPKIIHSYEQAVQLDPEFALAWARLSLRTRTVTSSANTSRSEQLRHRRGRCRSRRCAREAWRMRRNSSRIGPRPC